MEKKQSYLERLVGKHLNRTGINTSTVAPIGVNEKDPTNVRMTITIQFYFEDYVLNVYNPITIVPENTQLNDFIGLSVIYVSETTEEAKLFFDNDAVLVVNLRDEAYYDPEAMTLYGPDNFCAVWN